MLGVPDNRPPAPAVSPWRAAVKYTWFVVVAVALVVGLVLYSRWDENHKIEQQAAQKKRQQDAHEADLLGGNRFEILQFYAMPAAIQHGDVVHLCYGVSNAKAVKLEPQTDGVWPSLNHCVIVTPAKDTTYTLTATDANGQTKTQSVSVAVR